jgi:hypothetical protein
LEICIGGIWVGPTGKGNGFKHKNFDDFIICVGILCAIEYALAVGLCVFFQNPGLNCLHVDKTFAWSFYQTVDQYYPIPKKARLIRNFR